MEDMDEDMMDGGGMGYYDEHFVNMLVKYGFRSKPVWVKENKLILDKPSFYQFGYTIVNSHTNNDMSVLYAGGFSKERRIYINGKLVDKVLNDENDLKKIIRSSKLRKIL